MELPIEGHEAELMSFLTSLEANRKKREVESKADKKSFGEERTYCKWLV